MEQVTDSKLRKEYGMAAYCYSAYLTYIESSSGGLVAKLCPTRRTPQTVAGKAPLSMGFPSKNTGVACHFLLQRSSQPRG